MNQKQVNYRKFLGHCILLAAFTLGCFSVAHARQFRQLQPIASPNSIVLHKQGIKPVERVEQLSRKEIEPHIRDLLNNWNTQQMADSISDQFFDKSRLMDAVDTVVPRDAKIRLQSIQGIQTLQQYIQPSSQNGSYDRISIVSATVQTQVEYNGTNGLVRLQGRNELLLEVIQTPK